MRKWLKTYIKSLRRDIVILLILDVAFLLVMELWLRNIPAPFPIFVKIGNLTVTLAISFLASFVFYFVQVHLHDTKQKADLYPSVAALYKRILITEKSMIQNFAGATSYEQLSAEMIEKGVNERDINKKDTPLIIAGNPDRNANWLEYAFNELRDIDKSWDMIMRYSNYLDSECLSLLSKVQSDGALGFFRTLKGIYLTTQGPLNIQGFGASFVSLWHLVKEQEAYYNKTFAEFENK